MEIAKMLIEHGADVNAKTAEDWTPLHVSCVFGFVDITKFLIENGAIVDAKGMENVTPLGIAAYSGRLYN